VLAGDEGGLPPEIFHSTVALLEELTAISSPSGDAAGLERMAARLAAALAARGLEVEVRRGLEAPAVSAAGGAPAGVPPRAGETLARGREEATGPAALPVLLAGGPAAAGGGGHLLLIGHLDTVLPAAPPRREGGRLVATGAVDMKGGLAALAGALDLLARRGVAPPPGLRVVAVPDEEVGGELSRAAVERWGATARALWVLEPGEPGSVAGAETLVGGRRGMFDWRLEVQGTSAHSGLHLADGRSALLAAARWCLEASAGAGHGGRTDPERAAGAPTVNVGRLVAGDQTFTGDLAAARAWLGTDRQRPAGRALRGEPSGECRTSTADVRRPPVHPGWAAAATGGSGGLNVVPDRAIAEGEARFATVAEGEEVARRLARLAAAVGAATGTSLDWTRRGLVPPVEPGGPQRAWCERAVALAAARGWLLEIEERRGGISFPNFLPDPGRLPVLDGLGPVGGGMHTRAEYVDLASLRRRVVLLADLLQAEAATHLGAP
jgi:acetylornithine deacetylase/succinyl-diaminopimelate desuccinylase-like protein